MGSDQQSPVTHYPVLCTTGRDARRTRSGKDDALLAHSSWRCVVSWIVLIAAGLCETAWALALKQSDGFSKAGPTAVFLMMLVVSMVLLALALRDLPVGTGYAVWTGIGAVGAALAGMIWL